jgi:uncharacterized phage protein gp47/JayE
MSSFGVLSTGFNPKLIADVLTDIEARQKADFGSTINVGGESVIGQNNATFAAAVAEAWEVLHAVYRSMYPDSATGEALDNVCAITGVVRNPATKSTITLDCTGTNGTYLAIGRVISVDATGERFVSVTDGTIAGGTVAIDFESEEYGPVQLLNGQALTIETPVAGWSGVDANEDAVLGDELETDAELRLRRLSLLRFQGAATIEAIRADLLDVDGVLQVYVYENVSMVTDGRNLPPKSIEAIVHSEAGTPTADIAEALFLTKPAGIETYGHAPNNVNETVTDSQGIDHDINYTEPDDTPIYIRADIKYDQASYPTDGDTQIKAALKALGDEILLGETVYYERFQAEVFAIDGVVDCPVFYIDTVSPPTGTNNLTFITRELATFDTGDITVNSSPV